MFWGFFFRLLVGAVLAPIMFSLMLVPLIGLMALTARGGRSKLSPFAYPVLALMLLAQLYFWGMWAAYSAALTLARVSHPDVTHSWLYYVVAFRFVTGPLGYLASKEQASAGSLREVRGTQQGSVLYSGMAIVAFLVFSMWPGLMTAPYGWFLAFTVPMERRAVQVVPIAESGPREYVDNEYNFAFQFPADWRIEKPPPPGEAGEARAFVRHPTKPMHVMALVGRLRGGVSKRQYEANPNSGAVVDRMVELTIEQVYKKTSREIGAEQMIVSEKRVLPSDAGIRFYISTAHIVSLPKTGGKATFLVAGFHVVPFDKPYMVTFIMNMLVDKTATKDNETITKVFNSFHIVGERPIQ